MESIAALSLAANIVQFVTFTCKLVTQSKEIYSSADGVPEDAAHMQTVVEDIQEIMTSIKTFSNGRSRPVSPRLSALTTECNIIASDILNAIKKISAKCPNSKWSSFKVALKSIMRPDQVKRLNDRLSQLQSKIIMELSVILLQDNSAISAQLEEMEDDRRRFDTQFTGDLTSLRLDVVNAITRFEAENKLSQEVLASQLDRLCNMQEQNEQDVAEMLQKMVHLQSSLDAFADNASQSAIAIQVLRSLHYPQFYERYNLVKDAHPETSQWVFDMKFSGGPSPDRTFDEWLKFDHGICWLAGKPGSGKSTLMKKILAHARTRESLEEWAQDSGSVLFMASYFFWYAGSTLQKSQLGLLRAMLFEVLHRNPRFITQIYDERSLAGEYMSEVQKNPWTLPKLVDMMQKLASAPYMGAKFCFFVDGLDEYQVPDEGNHSDLVQLLETLCEIPNVKICASSREENAFRNIYLERPHFILQELNAEDIRTYTRRQLADNVQFQLVAKTNTQYIKLQQTIVSRSQGVFLWVFLVIRELLEGITNRDRVEALIQLVNSMPESLEGYFTRIIHSIQQRYRRSAVRTLRIACDAPELLNLLTFDFFYEDETQNATTSETHALEGYPEDLRRRLSARTKGLLEIVTVSSRHRSVTGVRDNSQGLLHRMRTRLRTIGTDWRSAYFAHRVIFLHRTVRDFLVESTEIRDMFHTLLPEGFYARRELCKAYGRLLRVVPLCMCGCDAYFTQTMPNVGGQKGIDGDVLQHRPFDTILWSLLAHAKYMWNVHGDPMSDVLRTTENVVFTRTKQWRQNKGTAFIALAAEFGLTAFVQSRLYESPDLLSSNRRSLLDHALQTDFLDDQLMQFHLSSEETSFGADSPVQAMIEMLLSFGISPNVRWRGCEDTAWTRFLCQVYMKNSRHWEDQSWDHIETTLARILRLLLEHGADLEVSVEVAEQERIEEKLSTFTKAPSKLVVYRKSAKEVIQLVFEDLADEILKSTKPI